MIVIYKGDAGYLSMEDAQLDAYLRRGGGLVSSTTRSAVPTLPISTLVGGAKKHGEVNYTLEASIDTPWSTREPDHEGMTAFKIQDEPFYS